MQVGTMRFALRSCGDFQAMSGSFSRGGVRRHGNEDRYYVSPSSKLFVVADGIGGCSAGEVASELAVDVLSSALERVDDDADSEEIEGRILAALDRAHTWIEGAGHVNPRHRGAGTTVALGMLRKDHLYFANVGDSRAYRIRRGSIERLTVDDTLPDIQWKLGCITADAARQHSMRNVLLRALGKSSFDCGSQGVQKAKVCDGDRYLVCSDGLTDVVNDDRLLEIVAENDDPQVAAEELVRESVNNGGGDDVTCIVVHVQNVEGPIRESPLRMEFERLLTGSLGRVARVVSPAIHSVVG